MEPVLVEVIDVADGKDATRSLLDDGIVVVAEARQSLELFHVMLD